MGKTGGVDASDHFVLQQGRDIVVAYIRVKRRIPTLRFG
jgi:hypothetical protein